jgi:hypothetical protein
MYESGEKGRQPNPMKDSDRLREAQKQIEIVLENHDHPMLERFDVHLGVIADGLDDD